MHHVMFDIDGTLVESYEIDTRCFIDAVEKVTGLSVNYDWSTYHHVTDSGILDEVLRLGGYSNREYIKVKVKQVFLEELKASLERQPVNEIFGAGAFLKKLQSMSNVAVSIATGGWRESAILKLESAGINIDPFPLASSDDHYSRVEIMKIAADRFANHQCSCTYFGDAAWDKEACSKLGYNFVLVGNKIIHNPSISDFQSTQSALQCVGL